MLSLLVTALQTEVSDREYTNVVKDYQSNSDTPVTITVVGRMWISEGRFRDNDNTYTEQSITYNTARLGIYWTMYYLDLIEYSYSSYDIDQYIERYVHRVHKSLVKRIGMLQGQPIEKCLYSTVDWLMSDFINEGMARHRFMQYAELYLATNMSVNNAQFQNTPYIKNIFTSHYYKWVDDKLNYGEDTSAKVHINELTKLNIAALKLMQINVNRPEYVYATPAQSMLRLVGAVCADTLPNEVTGYPLRGDNKKTYLTDDHVTNLFGDMTPCYTSPFFVTSVAHSINRSRVFVNARFANPTEKTLAVYEITKYIVNNITCVSDIFAHLHALGLVGNRMNVLIEEVSTFVGETAAATKTARLVEYTNYATMLSEEITTFKGTDSSTLPHRIIIRMLGVN